MLLYLLTFAVGFGLGVGITVILWSACSLSGQTAQPEQPATWTVITSTEPIEE